MTAPAHVIKASIAVMELINFMATADRSSFLAERALVNLAARMRQ
jgi:hypothetical protein